MGVLEGLNGDEGVKCLPVAPLCNCRPGCVRSPATALALPGQNSRPVL